MNGIRLAGFSVTVADLDRAAEFYTRGLGLVEKAKEDHDDMHEIMVGGEHDTTVIVLVHFASLDQPARAVGDVDKILLTVDDATATYERGLTEGGSAVNPPRRIDEAAVTFAELRDPDGLLVQLIEHHTA